MTMTTDDAVLLVDMSTLRFTSAGPKAPLRVTTRSGLTLAVVHPRKNELRSDLAFRAMDEALKTGRVTKVDPHNPAQRRTLRVALYNPFSGDVAYGAAPETRTFPSGSPLALDPDGTPATVAIDGTHATLHIADRALPAVERDVLDVTRVIAAQSVR